MSRRIGTLVLGCALLLACKPEGSTSNPDAGENLLGGGSSPGSGKKKGVSVPVKCISDPSDPDCEEVLGYTRTDDGSLEFGDTCRKNVCNEGGECALDAEGAVACECDEGWRGLNCERAPK